MELNAALAAGRYAAARPATAPDATPDPAGLLHGASSGTADAARDFLAQVRQGEATAQAALTGSADSHDLVQALAQTQLAVETAVTIRDKVVEAYQEILRMPV